METKKGWVQLDKCHSLAFSRPKPGVPHVVIMKLHYPADKMRILLLGGKQKFEYENMIIIRQDIPQNVLQQRRNFNAVCQKLTAKSIRFSDPVLHLQQEGVFILHGEGSYEHRELLLTLAECAHSVCCFLPAPRNPLTRIAMRTFLMIKIRWFELSG